MVHVSHVCEGEVGGVGEGGGCGEDDYGCVVSTSNITIIQYTEYSTARTHYKNTLLTNTILLLHLEQA